MLSASACHLFQDGELFSEILPLFKSNENVNTLFVWESGVRTYFRSKKGLTNKISMGVGGCVRGDWENTDWTLTQIMVHGRNESILVEIAVII